MKLGLGNSFVKDNGRGKKLIAPTAPSLDLQFAATKSLTAIKGPTPVLTRASTATYRDSSNVLQTAEINAPRFHHDESYAGATATATSASYGGIFYFDQFTDFAESGVVFPSFLNNNGDRLEYRRSQTSWYINNEPASSFALTLRSLGLLVEAPATNLVLNSSTLRSSGYTFTITNTSEDTKTYILSADAASYNPNSLFDSYNEDNYDFQPMRRSFYYFQLDGTFSTTFQVTLGAVKNIQVEEVISGAGNSTGSTSYIPTGATQVTRAADVCTISGADFSGFYNASAGTLVSQFTSSASSNASYVALSNGNIAANSIHFDNDPATPSSRAVYYSGSSVVANLGLGAQSAVGTIEKFATAYSVNDFAASRNGGTVVTDNTGAVPVGLSQMNIGSDERTQGINYTNGCIASIQYYKSRLSNSMLKTISK
jgi:hypothetical protein